MKTIHNGVPELSGKEFVKHISEGTVVVDFFAEWCMPCLIMAPVFEELAEKFKGKIKFAKINVDDNNDLSSKLKIMSIPTTIIFQDGKEVKRYIGSMQADDLEERIKLFVKK